MQEQVYHPFAWRGWWDFGTGALGDMACHILDASFWALDLRYPTAVEVVGGEPRKPENGPQWEVLRYSFPARGAMPALELTWYDGGKKPPAELFDGEKVKEGGCAAGRRAGQGLRPRRLRREARPAAQGEVRRLQEPARDDRPRPRREPLQGLEPRLQGPLEAGLLGLQLLGAAHRDGPARRPRLPDRPEDRVGRAEHEGPQLLGGRGVHPASVSQGVAALRMRVRSPGDWLRSSAIGACPPRRGRPGKRDRHRSRTIGASPRAATPSSHTF